MKGDIGKNVKYLLRYYDDLNENIDYFKSLHRYTRNFPFEKSDEVFMFHSKIHKLINEFKVKILSVTMKIKRIRSIERKKILSFANHLASPCYMHT